MNTTGNKLNRSRYLRLLCVAATAWLFFRYVITPVRVVDNNLTPANSEVNHSWHLVSRISYWFSTPKPGDTVAIRYAGQSVLLLAQIFAEPEAELSISGDQLQTEAGTSVTIPNTKRHKVETLIGKLALDDFFVIDLEMSPELNPNPTFGRVKTQRIIGKVLW